MFEISLMSEWIRTLGTTLIIVGFNAWLYTRAIDQKVNTLKLRINELESRLATLEKIFTPRTTQKED